MRIAVLAFLFPAVLFAQSAEVVPDRYLANKRVGIAPCPLFNIAPNDSMLFSNGKPKFVLPKTKGISGFAFQSCPDVPRGYPFDGRTLVYFTHIGEDGMQAYVDRNFNYDYTDDGLPSVADENGCITVSFSAPCDPARSTGVTYKLLSKSLDVTKIPTAIFTGNPYYAGVALLAPNAWLSAEQQWIKGMDVVIGSDSLCAVFFDMDIDGCFTGSGDMIALVPYGSDSAYSTKTHGVRMLKPGLIIGFYGKAYEIVVDTANCYSVMIRPRPDHPAPITLAVGDPLPHFSIGLFSGDSVDIYTLMRPGTYTYIDFWGTWCGGCRMAIPSLVALNDTMQSRLTIISLDAYDRRDKAKAFAAENGMSWTQGFSNAAAEELLYAGDGFPYGVLVDPNGRIVAFDVHASGVPKLVR